MTHSTRTARIPRRLGSLLSLVLLAGAGATACTTAPHRDRGVRLVASDGCRPMPDTQLVALADDRRMARAGNIVPAINEEVAEAPLVEALNRVSRALDQSSLIRLNRATDIEKKSPQTAAAEFAVAANLADDAPVAAGTSGGSGRRVVIGVSDFTGNLTLGHVYRVALTAAGYNAVVLKVGAREVYEPALERGEVHVVPEYLGPLAEFLDHRQNGTRSASLDYGDPDKAHDALNVFGPRAGLVFGEHSRATDQNTFAVTKALADRYHLRTLSDLADLCSGPDTVLGGPSECPSRPLCQAGLESVYGLAVGRFLALDTAGAVTRWGLSDGLVTVGLVLSSDPALVA